ncbi:MAG: hypothetical protein E7267_03920 [Lachnospiraceae bacterium]|nr:hypothetical protein [Lachnospiraceae bacterium]
MKKLMEIKEACAYAASKAVEKVLKTKGILNGLASLDNNGKVPNDQLNTTFNTAESINSWDAVGKCINAVKLISLDGTATASISSVNFTPLVTVNNKVDLTNSESYSFDNTASAVYTQNTNSLDVSFDGYGSIILWAPEGEVPYTQVKVTLSNANTVNFFLFDEDVTDAKGQVAAGQHDIDTASPSGTNSQTTYVLDLPEAAHGGLRAVKIVRVSPNSTTAKITAVEFIGTKVGDKVELDLSSRATYTIDGNTIAEYNRNTNTLECMFAWGTGIIFKAPVQGACIKAELSCINAGTLNSYVFDENFINGIGEDAAGQHEMQKITPSSTLERIVPGERFDKMLSKINNAIYVLINRAQALKTLGLNFSRHTEDTDAHMTAEEKAAYVKGTLLHSLPSDYTQLGNAYRNQVLSAEAGFCIYNNAMYSFVNKASISKELYYGEISTTSEGRVNLTLTLNGTSFGWGVGTRFTLYAPNGADIQVDDEIYKTNNNNSRMGMRFYEAITMAPDDIIDFIVIRKNSTYMLKRIRTN